MTLKSLSALSLLAFLSRPAMAQQTVQVGDEAPDFELSDARGQRYKLSDFRGKNSVVLEFFRSGDW